MQGRERRIFRRYPVDVDAEYRLASDGSHGEFRPGRIVNLSNSGMLLECEQKLRVGVAVELIVNWPIRPPRGAWLKLRATGEITRAGNNGVAVRIVRSAFEMAGSAMQPVFSDAPPAFVL